MLSTHPLRFSAVKENSALQYPTGAVKKRQISNLDILLQADLPEQAPSVLMHEQVEQPGILNALHACFKCYVGATLTIILIYKAYAVMR